MFGPIARWGNHEAIRGVTHTLGRLALILIPFEGRLELRLPWVSISVSSYRHDVKIESVADG